MARHPWSKPGVVDHGITAATPQQSSGSWLNALISLSDHHHSDYVDRVHRHAEDGGHTPQMVLSVCCLHERISNMTNPGAFLLAFVHSNVSDPKTAQGAVQQ